MQVSRQDLEGRFAEMDDERLLRSAADRDNLTELALSVALEEVHRRGLREPDALVHEAPPTRPKAWVTIDRFRDLSAAIVARSALEAAEIECFLRDENLVRMDWQVSNFIGGMRLDVLQEDAEIAQDVLAGMSPEDDPASDTGAVLSSERCPACGSSDIQRQAKRRGLSLAALFLASIPLPTGPAEWRCQRCGNRWRDAPG